MPGVALRNPGTQGVQPDFSFPDSMRGAMGTRQESKGPPGSAPCYSPETAGVGLAQDTVVRRGQGVKPEVSKALVGVGLGGGGALKSIVTGRREKRTSGDSGGQGPHAEDAEADPRGPVPEGRQD